VLEENLLTYLAFGLQAFIYVRHVKGIVATNIPAEEDYLRNAYGQAVDIDELGRNASIWTGMNASNIVGDELVARDRSLFERIVRGNDAPLSIRARALAAITTHIGNCEQQASVAFDYLARSAHRQQVGFALEMVNLRNLRNDEQDDRHVVVVIGRGNGAIEDPSAWNPEAIICDPWAEEAYPVSELQARSSPDHLLYPYIGDAPGAALDFRLEANADWPWDTELETHTLPDWSH
jgi:hypothetical protein